MTGQPPNVLLVMVDQLTAFGLGAYGNDEVLTPHLDALAERGVVFENAYANSPLCVPSRAAMMTGRLPSEVPCNDNAEEFPASVPTFAHTLRRAGYRTVLAGKMHFVGPDQLHGFEERLTTDIFPADLTWTRPWESLGDPPRLSGRQRSGGREYVDILGRSGPQPWTYQMHYDEEVRFRTLQRLRELALDSGPRRDDPWLLVTSLTQPHDPYAAPAQYWDRYEGRPIRLPDRSAVAAERHALDAWVNAFHGVDRHDVSDEQVYRARRGYYAMISYVDDVFGELVAELDRLGLAGDTVVMFTSDHGDQLGEHDMFFKRTLREWSVRVPLLAAGAGVASGHRVATPVSLADLHPTLADLAGTTLPGCVTDRFDGASLAPQLAGREAKHPDVILENYAEGTIAPVRAVVRGRTKLVRAPGVPDQLYDLGADPAEERDVVDDPAYADMSERMRTDLSKSWDAEEARRTVVTSQRMRAFLGEAMAHGRHHAWDHEPAPTRRWVRSADDDPWDPLFGF